MASPSEKNTAVKVVLKTLTPLWTAGANGKMARIYESGLLGSLRWWHEAIVRALGGWACDPSGDIKCLFDAAAYEQSQEFDERLRLRDAGLCDVCQLFGATGWRRRFQLQVVEDHTQALWTGEQLLNIRPEGRSRGWFLPPGHLGTFSLRLQGAPSALAPVLALLHFAEQHASLGPKPQLGYGVVEILNKDEVKPLMGDFSWEHLLPQKTAQGYGNSTAQRDLPRLDKMGFFRYCFQPEHSNWWMQLSGLERVARFVQPFSRQTIPLAPLLKNSWRFDHWRRSWGRERDFWGLVEAERQRGKVAVSWAYRADYTWEIRGSVWLDGLVDPKSVWAMFQNTDIWANTLGMEGKLTSISPKEWKKTLGLGA